MRADWVRGDPDDDRLHAYDGDDSDRVLDLDKLWHGIHFLLTGEAWEGDGTLAMAVMGGDEVGQDLGYGPARRLEVHDVEAVAEALSAVDFDALREEYDAAEFVRNDIYPAIWDEPEVVEELLEGIGLLAAFYRAAAAAGQAVVIRIS